MKRFAGLCVMAAGVVEMAATWPLVDPLTLGGIGLPALGVCAVLLGGAWVMHAEARPAPMPPPTRWAGGNGEGAYPTQDTLEPEDAGSGIYGRSDWPECQRWEPPAPVPWYQQSGPRVDSPGDWAANHPKSPAQRPPLNHGDGWEDAANPPDQPPPWGWV